MEYQIDLCEGPLGIRLNNSLVIVNVEGQAATKGVVVNSKLMGVAGKRINSMEEALALIRSSPRPLNVLLRKPEKPISWLRSKVPKDPKKLLRKLGERSKMLLEKGTSHVKRKDLIGEAVGQEFYQHRRRQLAEIHKRNCGTLQRCSAIEAKAHSVVEELGAVRGDWSKFADALQMLDELSDFTDLMMFVLGLNVITECRKRAEGVAAGLRAVEVALTEKIGSKVDHQQERWLSSQQRVVNSIRESQEKEILALEEDLQRQRDSALHRAYHEDLHAYAGLKFAERSRTTSDPVPPPPPTTTTDPSPPPAE